MKDHKRSLNVRCCLFPLLAISVSGRHAIRGKSDPQAWRVGCLRLDEGCVLDDDWFLGVLEMIVVKCSGHFSLCLFCSVILCKMAIWFSFSCILHLDCLHFAIWDALFRCCFIVRALFSQTLLPSISCWNLQCGQVVLYQNDEADIMFLVSACLRSIISFTDTDVNNPGWWVRQVFRATGNTFTSCFPFSGP